MNTKSRKITSGTREWADHTVNCISGCANNCRYCYAKMIAKRFHQKTDENWKDMEIREKDVVKNYGKYKGRVMFPSSHDIVDIPEVKEACFTVINKLLDAGNELLITSKPSLGVTKDIIEEFGDYKGWLQFRFTITSSDNDFLSFWEQNAPPYEERLESLRLTHDEGFKTSVSVEPFLDERPWHLIEELDPYVTESIWLGTMNYIPRKDILEEHEQEYDRIRRIIEPNNLRNIYTELIGHPKIKFKDSIALKLGIPDINSFSPENVYSCARAH